MKHDFFLRRAALSVIGIASLLSLSAEPRSFQKEIDLSYQHIYLHATMSKLDSLILSLQQQAAGKDNRYLSYWYAYSLYKGAIAAIEYYNYDREAYAPLKEKGLAELKEAAETLEKIRTKTSEDYALLALVKNAGLPFCSPLRIPFVSNEVKKYAETAVRMDEKNIRAWLALGIRDFHTPELYGGRQQFEEIFLRILALDAACGTNEYDPTWGQDDAYAYLIGYYWEEQPERARELLAEALIDFPDDHRLEAYRTRE